MYLQSISHVLLLLLFLVFTAWVAWEDIRTRKIPNKAIVPFFLVFMAFQVITDRANMLDYIIGSVAGCVFLLLAHAFNPKGMGMGDVKLMAVIGLLVGWTGVALTLFLSCIVGAFVAITLILTRRMTIKDTIPFGAVLAPIAFVTFAFDWHKIFWDFLISMV
ncbi:hypothetical protein ABE38_24815 [Brevibacillus agri]|nr:A24 family peptidase [Brevibacillus agri]MBG9568425.1 hypothetical protein [Brevibacillus agri]MBG9568491.1 hypothetical protein [Brevibacillus agri]